MKHSMRWLVLSILCISLIGCSDMMKAKPLAESEIKTFHQLFNEEKYSEIYSSADSDFQKTGTQEKLTAFLSAIHRKLGKVKSSSNKTYNVNTYNMTTKISMVQDTTFEQGSGTETFTFVISGSEAVLLGYNINSNDLIIK